MIFRSSRRKSGHTTGMARKDLEGKVDKLVEWAEAVNKHLQGDTDEGTESEDDDKPLTKGELADAVKEAIAAATQNEDESASEEDDADAPVTKADIAAAVAAALKSNASGEESAKDADDQSGSSKSSPDAAGTKGNGRRLPLPPSVLGKNGESGKKLNLNDPANYSDRATVRAMREQVMQEA